MLSRVFRGASYLINKTCSVSFVSKVCNCWSSYMCVFGITTQFVPRVYISVLPDFYRHCNRSMHAPATLPYLLTLQPFPSLSLEQATSHRQRMCSRAFCRNTSAENKHFCSADLYIVVRSRQLQGVAVVMMERGVLPIQQQSNTTMTHAMQ